MNRSLKMKTAAIFAITVAFIALYIIAGEATYAVSSWPSFRGNEFNNGLVGFGTPIEQKATEPVWIKKFGESASGMSGWAYAPNTPIIVNGDIVTTSSKTIMRIDSDTGKVLDEGTMGYAVNWGYTPLTYAEMEDKTGVLYCPLAGGNIQAFDADDLGKGPLWTFKATEKDAAGNYVWGLTPEDAEGNQKTNSAHQSISPIVYSDGMIYTGFFAGKYDFYDYYVAISARDQKLKDPATGKEKDYKAGDLVWKYKSKGGFYWNGAVVVGDALIVGTQDGASNNDVTGQSGEASVDSHILSFNKKTGEIISDVALPNAGDICSSIVYDKNGTGRLFWTACGGYICSAAVNTETGELSDIKQVLLAKKDKAPLTVSTPVVYTNKNGYSRVYFGYKEKGVNGYFTAYDAESLAMYFKKEMDLYSKSSPLITSAYEAGTGYLYAYMATYDVPGGVVVIKFRSDATDTGDVTISQLFNATGYEEYGAASLIADDNGRLYYKNDSNSIFAIGKCDPVTPGKATGVKIKKSGSKAVIKWTKSKQANTYRLLYRLNETGSFKRKNLKKNTYSIKIKNPTVVTVRIRPEYIDAAKSVYGEYSDEMTTYLANSKIKKLTAGKGSFTVKYDKHKISDGYQIEYSLKKNMSYPSICAVKGYSKVKYTVDNLQGKKTYYVRVRSWKTVGQKKVNGKWTGGVVQYGSWSKVKKVKTKAVSSSSPYQTGY